MLERNTLNNCPAYLASAECHPVALIGFHRLIAAGVNLLASSLLLHLQAPSLRGGLFCGLMRELTAAARPRPVLQGPSANKFMR